MIIITENTSVVSVFITGKRKGLIRLIIFTTARFTGKGTLEYIKEKIEATGAQVINQYNFKRLFWIGKKRAVEFGEEVNNQ